MGSFQPGPSSRKSGLGKKIANALRFPAAAEGWAADRIAGLRIAVTAWMSIAQEKTKWKDF
jgi:hypothetical protein